MLLLSNYDTTVNSS